MRFNLRTQTERQLLWFQEHDVQKLDLALRVPRQPGVDYHSDSWMWLRQNREVELDRLVKTLLPWARYMNTKGADVYVRPSPGVDGSILFLDDVPLQNALRVAKKYSSCVIETSPGNTQIWMATTRKLSIACKTAEQIHLCSLGYTDPRSTSGDHFGRLCGFLSQKRNCWVNFIMSTRGLRYEPILSAKQRSLPHPKGGGGRASSLGSASEKDFGWVCGRLRAGYLVSQVTYDLERSACVRGKKSPKQYANRSVQKALSMI